MFAEVTFPECPGFGFQSQPLYSVTMVQTAAGRERRNRNLKCSYQMIECQVGPRDESTVANLLEFWHAIGGAECGFRFKDWSDYKSVWVNQDVSSADQIFEATKVTHVFQMVKAYTVGSLSHHRKITKPVIGSIVISYNGVDLVEGSDYTINYTLGLVTCASASNITLLKWGGEFDVPVRFNSEFPVQLVDQRIQSVTFALKEIPDIESEATSGDTTGDDTAGDGGGGTGPVTRLFPGNNSQNMWDGSPLGAPGDGTMIGYTAGNVRFGGGSVGAMDGNEIAGHLIENLGWQVYTGGGAIQYFMVVLVGNYLQSEFAHLIFSGSYSNTFLTGSADIFDNTSKFGYTLWAWIVTDANDVTGNPNVATG